MSYSNLIYNYTHILTVLYSKLSRSTACLLNYTLCHYRYIWAKLMLQFMQHLNFYERLCGNATEKMVIRPRPGWFVSRLWQAVQMTQPGACKHFYFPLRFFAQSLSKTNIYLVWYGPPIVNIGSFFLGLLVHQRCDRKGMSRCRKAWRARRQNMRIRKGFFTAIMPTSSWQSPQTLYLRMLDAFTSYSGCRSQENTIEVKKKA